jgi:hypothetical protein
LFASLITTSVIVHQWNHIVINLLDKFVLLLIFLYGGYTLYKKQNGTVWRGIQTVVITSTCLFVFWVYFWGYVVNDMCFHPDPKIGVKYHVAMHFAGGVGHNMIMLLT